MGQNNLNIFGHIYHIMEYRFGPNKPNFTGTDAEWNKLKEKIAWWNAKDASTYPNVTVICPHCGAKNTHILDGTFNDDSHRACNLVIDRKGKNMYDCPGYYICRYANTPR